MSYCQSDIDQCTWQTNRLFSVDPFTDDYTSRQAAEKYYNQGFLTIQNAITKASIKKYSPSVNIPKIFVQKFPKIARTGNVFIDILPILIPIFFLISFNYAFINSVRYIANEKEKQLKEAMKIMGLATWMQHLSWFIRTMTMLLIPIAIITAAFTVLFSTFI